MKSVVLLVILVAIQSCIPLRVAPNIEDYKLKNGRKFKKGLPKKTVFVFEDPKDAGAFYDYVNTKYQLKDHYVDVEVPFELNGETYYFSFYEVEHIDKHLDLFPLFFDVAVNGVLGNDDFEQYTSSNAQAVKRKGNWYIALEVFTRTEKDCLSKTSNS
ncbi:MAG: hypothetical protein AAGF77_06030 [Bacteroidota bacterium]